MDGNEMFSAADLKEIADFALNGRIGREAEFVRKSEKAVAESLVRYTTDVSGRDEADAAALVEEHAGQLLDAVTDANYTYLENGMRLGAALLMQLLGLVQ